MQLIELRGAPNVGSQKQTGPIGMYAWMCVSCPREQISGGLEQGMNVQVSKPAVLQEFSCLEGKVLKA